MFEKPRHGRMTGRVGNGARCRVALLFLEHGGVVKQMFTACKALGPVPHTCKHTHLKVYEDELFDHPICLRDVKIPLKVPGVDLGLHMRTCKHRSSE